MTSNDTTNQSTAPVHIDEAIADVEHCGATVGGELWGWYDALRHVEAGIIITDDKLRADRMTRALATAWDQGLLVVHAGTPIYEAAIEARRWVEANPEVAS